MSLKSRCNNKNRCALAVESLEDRRMLALTPQLVFNEVYDTTATDPVDLSVIHDVDRAYWARFTYGAVGGNQSGMQGPNLMDASILVFDQDAGETSRIYGIPNEVPTAIVELNDELVLFYDSSPTWWADWRGVEAVGQEVWKVTRAGAEPLKKISRNGTGYSDQPGQVVGRPFTYRDDVYFTAGMASGLDADGNIVNGSLGLWKTDGTEAGTVPVTDLIPGVTRLLSADEINDRMLLTLETDSGLEYWTLDGTASGTEQLLLDPPSESIVFNDRLFFARETELGTELHVTDGTVAGTTLFADLVEGSDSSNPHGFFSGR